MKGFRVAIVGATGLVGQELIKVLEQRQFPVDSVSLFGADHSGARKAFFNHREVEVREPNGDSLREADIALLAAGPEVSRHLAPAAVQTGCLVIDSSAAFRMEASVPLIVPEVNAEDIPGHKGLVACPDPLTVQLAMVLYPLHRVNPVKRVVVAAYESVSGTGSAAIEELATQSKQVLGGQSAVPHVYPHQIAFNLLAETDVFLDNGYTREEVKIGEETRKVLHAPDLAISATCVRVPVFIGHGMAVNVELSQTMPIEEARQLLAAAPGIKVLDDPVISLYPQPWAAAGSDEVFVGRLRQDASHSRGLAMWTVMDNVRKGAALNAVQILEEMIKREWLQPRGRR